jgi:hypothetical protein
MLAAFCTSAMAETVTWITPIPDETAPGYADAIDWNNGANWSTGTVPTGADDVVFDYTMNSDGTGAGYDTILLNGNQAVNSLSFDGTLRSNNYNPGDPAESSLTINSGNILFNTAPDSYGSYVNWQTIIPETVTTATWTMRSRAYSYLSEITAGASTTIVLEKDVTDTDSRSFGFEGNNLTTLASPIDVKMVNGSGSGSLRIRDDYATGTGLITFYDNHNLSFDAGDGYTIANDINVNGANINVQVGRYSSGGVYISRMAVLEGNLTGTGDFTKQTTSSDTGIIVFAGDNNTFSGTIGGSYGYSRGEYYYDGVFTSLAGIKMRPSYGSPVFGGYGTIGMAQDAVVELRGSGDYRAKVAPGRDGEIGTLTVGTDGANNQMQFVTLTHLLVDVAGTESDLLAVEGTLSIGSDCAMFIDGVLDSATTYTLASYDTLSGAFAEVYLNDVLVTDLSSVNGTHELVYDVNALQLVALNPSVVGDVNGDGIVDYQDLGIMAGNWNMTSGADLSMGDLNGDGAVDYQDLGIMAGNWNYGVTATGTVVPEPATMGLLAIGGIAALIRRRRS